MTTTAFQPNAFFNQGFQVAQFSTVAFQTCAFSHTGFQTDICPSSGRSGYWRLFFTQMQEESLRKDKDAKTVKDLGSVDKLEIVNAAIPARKKQPVSKKRAPVEVEAFTPEPLPYFKRKPVYETQNTYESLAALPKQTLAVELHALRSNVHQFAEHLAAKQQRQRTRRRAVAFLLLAA